MEKIINGFYFEFSQYGNTTVLLAAFVTSTKPSPASNPVDNEQARVEALQNMFRSLSALPAYVVKFGPPEAVKAQSTGLIPTVTAVRGSVSTKDGSAITIEEVAKLIDDNFTPP